MYYISLLSLHYSSLLRAYASCPRKSSGKVILHVSWNPSKTKVYLSNIILLSIMRYTVHCTSNKEFQLLGHPQSKNPGLVTPLRIDSWNALHEATHSRKKLLLEWVFSITKIVINLNQLSKWNNTENLNCMTDYASLRTGTLSYSFASVALSIYRNWTELSGGEERHWNL